MTKRIQIWLAWGIIVLLAGYLRFDDIGSRPMHFDEATGAHIAAEQLETGVYTYNPRHFHGPALSGCTKLISFITGETSWEDLSARSLRLIPAFAGLAMVLVPLVWIRWTGHAPALATASLLATSPVLVYYSRMYIHEILLGLFSLVTLTAAVTGCREGKRIYWILTGVFLGLMVSTKETFVITLFAWCLSWMVCYVFMRDKTPGLQLLGRNRWIEPGVWIVSVSAVITVVLYTNFFRNPAAIIDLVRSYLIYETEPGHEKPFWYYAYLVFCPKGGVRLFWMEGAGIVLVFAAAAWLAGKFNSLQDSNRRFLIIFLAGSAIIHFLVYSLIGYKTPWLVLVPWVHVTLLAGIVVWIGLDASKTGRIVLLAGLVVALALNIRQSIDVAGKFANDRRNPYAYVPTSRDIETLENWLVALREKSLPESIEPIAVVGKYYWPLPWYLRKFQNVGYWDEMNKDMQQLAVLFIMPGQFESAKDLLNSTHTSLPRGLRQENPMLLYVRNDIWKKWMQEGGQ